MKNKIFTIFFILFIPFFLWAQSNQNGSISGFIYDKSNGEALIGVSVYIKELRIGNITNTSGYYVIPKIPLGKYTIIYTYIGYKTDKRKVDIVNSENRIMTISMSGQTLEFEEVVVTADSMRVVEKLFQKNISEIQLSPRQINQIPQIAEADLLRSLQTLPGILPLSDFSTALYIRGGTPDQNLYLLDGTDVYNPEHAFGIFSTFNTDAIKQVELSKGGFGAEYGGRLSSVLDITNLDGNRERFEGSASLSLLSAKTTLQMPIGKIGSVSGSIRRTYFDKTIAKTIDEVPDYYFYDGNIKAFFEINNNNKLTISGYGGRDYLNVIFNEGASDETGLQYDWGNRTGSIKWTRVFSPRLFSNFWITGSRFSSTFTLEEIDIKEDNDITDITLKGNLEYHYSREIMTKFGFEQKNFDVLYSQTFPGGEVDVHSKPKHYVGYFLGIWKPTPLWDIEGGIRYNLFDSDGANQDLSPRFSLKYRLTENTNVKGAFGVYHQYLHRIPRFFIADIWTNSNKFQEESTSRHYILGYQLEVENRHQLEIETFYKSYENIYSFNHTFITELTTDVFNEKGEPIYTETKTLFNRGDGFSTGFELFFRKDTGIMTGWLGYSFSLTKYEIDNINQDESFSPRHDRTSTINFVSTIDIKNLLRKYKGKTTKRDKGKWILGINYVFSTGQPFTEPGSGYITGSDPGDIERNVEFAPTSINNIRFPYYSRMDISITYEKQFKSWSLAPYIQVFNIGNRKNVWFADYEFNSGIPSIDEQHMFPLLPTIGFNTKF